MDRIKRQPRVVVWFSCGAASAAAAKLAVEKYGDRCRVVYCDTFAYEHPDNRRFFNDVQTWLGVKIVVRGNPDYSDIYDVFTKTRFLVSREGARCTAELKKVVRKQYQRPDDVHIFGFTVEETKRMQRFQKENFDVTCEFILHDRKVTKAQCLRMLSDAGIEMPVMYKLGYKNNNCIGCVKGGIGYWNKIRKDFPEAFARMAAMERELDISINTKRGTGVDGVPYRRRMFLDEMPPDIGRYEAEADVECGVSCVQGPPRDQEHEE